MRDTARPHHPKRGECLRPGELDLDSFHKALQEPAVLEKLSLVGVRKAQPEHFGSILLWLSFGFVQIQG